MSIPYASRVEPVQDGQAVDAANTNRPIAQLTQRTDALHETVTGALFGSAQVLRSVPMTSDCVVGTPVYLYQGVMRPAQYGFDASPTLGYSVSQASWCCGVVSSKQTSTIGDVTTLGLLQLTKAELEAVTDSGVADTGQLFLSAARAGHLAVQQPPIGIQVAYCDGPDADDNYALLIAPLPRNNTEQHIHYSVPLVMTTLDHTDTTSDPLPSGWVDAVTYDTWVIANVGAIPTGAKWVYVPSRDLRIAALWPLKPTSMVRIERNGVGLRTEGTNPDVLINDDALWYMRATQSPVAGTAITAVNALYIPGGPTDQIDLIFTRMVGRTNAVTNISNDDGTITVTDANGQPATTGSVIVRAKLPENQSADETGYTVVKVIEDAIQKRGPVLEGIMTDDPELTITGGVPVAEGLDIHGDPITATGYLAGRVKISLTNPADPFEGALSAISVDGVDIQDNSGVYTYTFRAGVDGSLRGCVRIPKRGVPVTGLNLSFEYLVLAKASGTLPDLTLTIRKLTEPVNLATTHTSLVGSDSAFGTLDLSAGGAITAGEYLRQASDDLLVYPGDLVYLTTTRSSGDGYAGDVGVMDVHWKLSVPPEPT